MTKMMKKWDIDAFEVTTLGLLAITFTAIVVEMFVAMFR